MLGGKFSNGAQSWAFQSAVMQDWEAKSILGGSGSGNLEEELRNLTDEEKQKNYKKNLKHFKNALKAIDEATDLNIPEEVLIVDESEINDYLAAVKCGFISGCENKVYVSKQYLQSGRERDSFLDTAYHEVLHFNDTRWNTYVTSMSLLFGGDSDRHQEIRVLSAQLRMGGVKGTLKRKIYDTYEVLSK